MVCTGRESLENVLLLPGKYRASPKSVHVVDCPTPDACTGTLENLIEQDAAGVTDGTTALVNAFKTKLAAPMQSQGACGCEVSGKQFCNHDDPGNCQSCNGIMSDEDCDVLAVEISSLSTGVYCNFLQSLNRQPSLNISSYFS